MEKNKKEDEKSSEKEKAEPEAKEEVPPKCKNCFFRIRNLCHRMPPQGDVGTRGGGFPRVKEDDWCGEHKPGGENTPEPEE